MGDYSLMSKPELRIALSAKEQRNRELTRQVEQLRARVDAAEKDVRRYQWLREHVKPWEGFDAGYPYCEIDIYLRELENGSIEKVSIIGQRDAVGMASLDTAVDIARRVEPSDIGKDWGPTMQELASGESRLGYTAPPSSSDPGREDARRE